MSVSIYAGNFNKDNNVKETSINYKENVSNRTNGINGIFNGVVMSEGQDNSRLADNKTADYEFCKYSTDKLQGTC